MEAVFANQSPMPEAQMGAQGPFMGKGRIGEGTAMDNGPVVISGIDGQGWNGEGWSRTMPPRSIREPIPGTWGGTPIMQPGQPMPQGPFMGQGPIGEPMPVGSMPIPGRWNGMPPMQTEPGQARPFMGHGPVVFGHEGQGFGGVSRPVQPSVSLPITEEEKGKILHLVMEIKNIEEDSAKLLPNRNNIFWQVEKILHEAGRQLMELAQGQKRPDGNRMPPALGSMQCTTKVDEHGCKHEVCHNGSAYTFDTVVYCPTKELCKQFECGVRHVQSLHPDVPPMSSHPVKAK